MPVEGFLSSKVLGQSRAFCQSRVSWSVKGFLSFEGVLSVAGVLSVEVFCRPRDFARRRRRASPLDVAGPGDPGAARIEWVKEPAKDDELVAPPDDGDGPANLREEAMSIRIS